MGRAETLKALRADAAAARMAGLTLPQGAAWANAARQEALARVGAMGLPTKRDEYWKYTDPATLTAGEAADAALRDRKSVV